jgi:DNA-directed RNA polymerase subunit H (RpoH/RPB5)
VCINIKMIASSLISSIYKSRRIIIDLLSRQGYAVADYANFSINEVNTMTLNKQLDMLVEKPSATGTATVEEVEETEETDEPPLKVYVRYYLGTSLKQQALQELMDDLFNLEEVLTKRDILYIIVKDEMNETLNTLVKHIWEQDGIFIVVQNLKRLQYNVLDHSLVPPHRILNAGELDIVKKKYNISNIMMLPEMSRFDPVAQVLFIRPGQVVEIKRPSKTAIESLYYRICV